MKLPKMPIPYTYIHTHEFPENAPHGWGTAYKHFTRKYEDIPGMLDEKDIPSNLQFWTDELEKCRIALDVAMKSGNNKKIDKALGEYLTAKNRLEKESTL